MVNSTYPRIKKHCFCGIHVHTTTKIVAWINIIWTLLTIVPVVFLIIFSDPPKKNDLYSSFAFLAIVIFLFIIALGINALLLYGVLRKRSGFYWPFLIVMAVFIVWFAKDIAMTTIIFDMASLYFILIYLTGTMLLINAKKDCSKAPSPSLRTVCEQLNKYDKKSRDLAAEMEHAGIGKGEIPPTANDCMTLGCLCNYLGGKGDDDTNQCSLPSKKPLKKALRKEYRVLSDKERKRYHDALLAIKRNGKFDKVAKLHSDFADSAGSHAGPAFLPWHREFLKRVEIELRLVDLSVSIPYWDSVLDSYLPTPADSIIWTDEFMGNSNGSVNKGPFANWKTLEGHRTITRKVGAEGSLFNKTHLNDFMSFSDINNVLASSAAGDDCPYKMNYNDIETNDGLVHLYVGGDMHETSTSANDPIFYLLYSFVDCVWEIWRNKNQDRDTRETEYASDDEDCSSSYHFEDNPMEPFQLKNVDGLSNEYTDNMYEYAPRPTCPSCGNSKYLFCMKSSGNCASKIKIGGNCQGLDESEAPCYNGVCQNGKCVEKQKSSSETVRTTPEPLKTTENPPEPLTTVEVSSESLTTVEPSLELLTTVETSSETVWTTSEPLKTTENPSE